MSERAFFLGKFMNVFEKSLADPVGSAAKAYFLGTVAGIGSAIGSHLGTIEAGLTSIFVDVNDAVLNGAIIGGVFLVTVWAVMALIYFVNKPSD